VNSTIAGMTILQRLKRIVFLPFDRSDRIPELSGRSVENDDAWAQGKTAMPSQVPPNYVPQADEGRPRH
jgi:hypothetical protein